MGTNFYLHSEFDLDGNPKGEGLHIGKSSLGWCFSLHVIPDDGINTLADWAVKFSTPPNRIYDEYGNRISPERMLLFITNRSPFKRREPLSQAVLDRNHAVEDPATGLLRHRVDGRCVGHGGDGTYDLIEGEFC